MPLKIYLADNRIKKFQERIRKTAYCWNWEGALTKSGYGLVYIGTGRKNNKLIYAHRLNWILEKGDIPKEKYVLHKCDNPSCVNPKHLFLGTAKENGIDMARKLRGTNKLSDTQVLEIRKLYKLGGFSQRQLARKYKVSQCNVFYLLHKINWSWL